MKSAKEEISEIIDFVFSESDLGLIKDSEELFNLLERIKNNDRKALEELIELVQESKIIDSVIRAVCAFCKTADREELEAIALENIEKVAREYNPTRGTKFSTFLYMKLKYAMLNELGRLRKKRPDYITPARAKSPEAELFSSEVQQLIRRNYEKYLDARQKFIISKFFGFEEEPLSMGEIGKLLNISRQAVWKQLQKSLELLRVPELKGLEVPTESNEMERLRNVNELLAGYLAQVNS